MHRSDIRQQPAPLHSRSSSCCCRRRRRRSRGSGLSPRTAPGGGSRAPQGREAPGRSRGGSRCWHRERGRAQLAAGHAAGRGAAGTQRGRSGQRAPRTAPGPLRPPARLGAPRRSPCPHRTASAPRGRRTGPQRSASHAAAQPPEPPHARGRAPDAVPTHNFLSGSAAPLRSVPGGGRGAPRARSPARPRAARSPESGPASHPAGPGPAGTPSRYRSRAPPHPRRTAAALPRSAAPRRVRARHRAPHLPEAPPPPLAGRSRAARCLPRPRSGLSPLAWRGGRARRARCPSRCRSRSGLGPASWRPRAAAPMEPAAPRRPLRRGDVGASAPAPPPYCAQKRRGTNALRGVRAVMLRAAAHGEERGEGRGREWRWTEMGIAMGTGTGRKMGIGTETGMGRGMETETGTGVD